MTEPAPRERGMAFRAMVPNAVTALALCCGLTGVRYGFVEEWERALGFIMLAGVLDGMDGRVARLSGLGSKFGAFYDSTLDRVADGAVLGGLAVGVVEQLGTLTILMSVPGARAMMLFAFLLGVLLLRPQGIFVGRAATA